MNTFPALKPMKPSFQPKPEYRFKQVGFLFCDGDLVSMPVWFRSAQQALDVLFDCFDLQPSELAEYTEKVLQCERENVAYVFRNDAFESDFLESVAVDAFDGWLAVDQVDHCLFLHSQE